MKLNLTALEARILGALIEKEYTTPETYPLSMNALLAACNQKSNRNPVMQLSEEEVARGLAVLQYDKQLVATYSGVGSRVVKYTHRLVETLGVDSPEAALLCELLLRGPQTPGELRGRASRMATFHSPAEVKEVLDDLAARNPPYVVELPRAPGRKESRLAHTFGDVSFEELAAQESTTHSRAVPVASPSVEQALQEEKRVHALEERVAQLEAAVAALEARR
jgi:uncharacterized protein